MRPFTLFGPVILAATVLGSSVAAAQDDQSDIPPGAIPVMPYGGSERILGQPPRLPPPADGGTTIMRTQSTPSILAILAHPDDEITIAPVLARIARSGGEVTLVFATSGDQGPGVSDLKPGAELASLREDEARCAAFALGIPEPIFWQMGDGTLSTRARAPDSAARDLAGRIEALIAIEQPETIMTWGPDGGYGHADHRMVSNAVTQVVQSLGIDRPDLLYAALPSGDGPDLPGFERWSMTDPSLITDRIHYDLVDLDAARSAIDCYVSQFDETARAYLPDMLHRNVWNGTVHFRLALPTANPAH